MNLERTWIGILLCVGLLAPAAASDISVEEALARAKDYAMTGLVEEAKRELVPLLHGDLSAEDVAKVRFFLGFTCQIEGNSTCTNYHWLRVTQDAPDSAAASKVRTLMEFHTFNAFDKLLTAATDWEFGRELEFSRSLWTFGIRVFGIDLRAHQDISFAVEYLDRLRERYRGDPAKEAQVLYNKFMLFAGFNTDGIGLGSGKTAEDDPLEMSESQYYLACKAISDELGTIPNARTHYVITEAILGLGQSSIGSKGRKIRLNLVSREHFENVMRATRGDTTSPFRFYAYIWLKDHYEDRGINPPEDFEWAPAPAEPDGPEDEGATHATSLTRVAGAASP